MARSRSHSRSYSSSPASSSRKSKSRRRSKSPSSSRRKHRYRSPDHSYKSKKSSRRYHSRRSQSPYYERERRHRKSLSRSSSKSSSTTSSSRSSSPHRKSTASASKIKLQKTPSPPPPPTLTFSSTMEFLDARHQVDANSEINADEFVPKSFKSDLSKNSGSTEAADAATAKTIKIHTNAPNEDPIFHQNVSFLPTGGHIQEADRAIIDFFFFQFQFYLDDEERMDKWIKKLYNYRQRQFTA